MVTTKNKQNKLSATLILSVLAVAVSLASIMMNIITQDRLNLLFDQESRHSREAFESSSRIRFCYDYGVQPCTDEEIAKWNKANPGERYGAYGLQ